MVARASLNTELIYVPVARLVGTNGDVCAIVFVVSLVSVACPESHHGGGSNDSGTATPVQNHLIEHSIK